MLAALPAGLTFDSISFTEDVMRFGKARASLPLLPAFTIFVWKYVFIILNCVIMKSTLLAASACVLLSCSASGQQPVKFGEPDMNRGVTLMQALSDRQSERAFDGREVEREDLGDLLWAANGINRPESGKRTAPSAMNRQDIKLYVLDRDGAYVYDPQEHALQPVASGDFRPAGPYPAPVAVLLVADEDGGFAGVDAGYVSQNIYLFCAANGMATVACGSMDEDAFRKACRLNDSQKIIVWHPVGYPAE